MVKRITSIAVLFLFVQLDVVSQTSMNMQLVGQLQTRGTNNYSSCWGYVAPNGNEYAILGTSTGTQIVDITSDTLKEIAFILGPQSSWREMKVYQKYAYVVTEGNGAGLQIIDLDSLKLVNTINTFQVPSGHTVSLEGKYLYINGARYGKGGIVVLDLVNPVDPVVVGEYQTEYVHDCFIKNDTIYAAAIYGDGLDIIDATDKTNIKRINLVQYPYSGTHNTAVSEDGKYVFTTDEINSDPSQNGNIVRVWDRTDVNNLTLVGSYVAKPFTIAHNIHVKGQYAYVAHYTEGLRVIDIKNPEIPVEVAFYDTYPGSANTYAGNWGTFPNFQSNKIIASDMSGGLFVMKFPGQNTGIPVARAIITVIDSSTNLPIEGVHAEIVGTSEYYTTDADGTIKFGRLHDTLTIQFSKKNSEFGYESVLQKILIPFDTTSLYTIKLQPLPTGSMNLTVKNAANSTLVNGASVQVQGTTIAGYTDSSGVFHIPQLLSGPTYRVLASKFGFSVDSVDVILPSGQTTAIDIFLTQSGKENFEINTGWTLGSPQDSGTLGRWARAIPKPVSLFGDTLQPGSDHSIVGDYCFVTGPTNSLSDNIEGRTTIVSPVFSVADMVNPTLLYWLFTNTRSNPVDDTLYVEISNDDGVLWKSVETVSGKQNHWIQHKIVLNNSIVGTDKMRIRFSARDGGVASVFEAAIDDIEFGDNLQLSVGKRDELIPSSFTLSQNFPNPFNPSTTIQYSIPVHGFTTLRVFDVLGKVVAALVEGEQHAGNYTLLFDGAGLSSGIYFYKLQSGTFSEVKKLMLMK